MSRLAERFRQGGVFVWFSGTLLAFCLAMILSLVGFIVAKGMGYFWPRPLVLVHGPEGPLLGEITGHEPARGEETEKTQFHVGNRDIYGQDFRWVPSAGLGTPEFPKDALLIERLEYGPFMGRIISLSHEGIQVATGPAAMSGALDHLAETNRIRRHIQSVEKGQVGDLNRRIERLRLARRKLETGNDAVGLQALDAKAAELQSSYDQFQTSLEQSRAEAKAWTLNLQTADGQIKELPLGSVVPFEETDETQRTERPLKQIGILKAVEKGKNIRYAGEDIGKGQLALSKGTILLPAQIGVLASLGLKTVKVIRRPVVAILATGDELVELGQPLSEGQIYNSNSYSAAAQVLRYGGIPHVLGIAKDTEEDLGKKINEALSADMLLTTGGVSMGDYDLVKDVLAKQGEISFWKVRMKPGKPLAFGTIKGVPHLGLPGNPVSSMITFELFARPAMLKMMGKTNLTRPTVEVIMESRIKNSDSRRIFARAIVRKEGDRLYAKTTGPQGSGILTSMSLANALVIVPEDVSTVKEGDSLQAIMLDNEE